MPVIKRYVLLTYNNCNFEFYQLASSDKQALIFSIRDLEKKLGKMHGSLKKHFVDKNNWEVKIL
jgi:hypothetical protein